MWSRVSMHDADYGFCAVVQACYYDVNPESLLANLRMHEQQWNWIKSVEWLGMLNYFGTLLLCDTVARVQWIKCD